jgi:Uma2 family endonuclease
MTTAVKLGPADHGRAVTLDAFLGGDYDEGYRYEIIEGRLYVSPMPRFEHDWIEVFVHRLLLEHSVKRPKQINWVTTKARVFVPNEPESTAPEPDIAAYRNFPRRRRSQVDWRDVSPILVVEILSPENPDKDLVRNVELYWRVPSIEEYWVFDNREDSDRPALRVYRRADEGWQVLDFGPDEIYTTPLLPDFQLPVTPLDD